MNTNATKNTPKAAEKGREQAAAEQAAKKDKTNATKTTKTAEKAEERKVNTMKTKTTNAAAKTAPKTEQTAATKTEDRRAAKIAALIEAAKTANRPEDRRKAAEQAAELIEAFNRESFTNAVNRADMTKAAEALKPNAPKKDESRRAFFAYANAENIVTFQFMDEDGHESTKKLSLVQYAAAAFMKTATKEQTAAFAAALAELEKVTAAAIEGRDKENGKNAAKALTALSAACGLDTFTTKTAEDGKKYPFYIDRSFVYAAAAPLRVKRGEVMTAAARLEAANVAAFAAAANKRTKAEERREKAEAAAVKAVFGIIAAAAEAAAVNVWKAHAKTAEDVRAEAAAAAEAATKREQAKKDREAKKAEREAKTAAAKREKAAKLREQAAALDEAAAKQEAATKTAAA